MARSALRELLPQAPDLLLDMLDPALGALDEPLRAEVFGAQRLAQHARSLGQSHRAQRARWRAASFFPRLQSNIATLRAAYRYIATQAGTGYDISPAAEWLLDNFHLVEAQLEQVHAGLPRSYFRALPVLMDEPLAGLPRVYGVACAFVAHSDSAFDDALLVQFLAAYQDTRELSLGEMWALPTTLRVVLIENLRRLAGRVAASKAARELANQCCDQLEQYPVPVLDDLLALLNQRGVGQVFLGQIAQRLLDRDTPAMVNGAEPNQGASHQSWLQTVLPDSAAAQTQQRVDQVADNLSVSNAVRSLRAIDDADWLDVVAQSSVVMRLMLTSPLFKAEHPTTRDQTLHGIEALARQKDRSEVRVASALLHLMAQATTDGDTGAGPNPDGSAGSAPGGQALAQHWLGGPGRPDLLAELGLPTSASVRDSFYWRPWQKRLALPVYLASLALGTGILMFWLLWPQGAAAWHLGTPRWLELGVVLLMLFPASEAVVAVVNRLISESVKPQRLARLALAEGIPPEHRVMVVIPALLTHEGGTRELVHRLQLHHLANPEAQAQFALLTDWVDADTAQLPADAALLADAVQRLQALNTKYPAVKLQANERISQAPRFILLHRNRQFSVSEQRWIGWERKRGKLELLVAALATGVPDAFLDLGEASRMAAHTRYVVTLDSDTQLPPDRLRELVGVAAHPINQPQVQGNAAQGGLRVVQGYGILQPRINLPLPAPKDFTPYHWLFAGQPGIDPYSAASSEVYQDLFGEGTFTGKGLLHVHALHAVLSQRLPQNQVLSHDLLEGALARCATVTDISLMEDAPFHADVAASRVHRWTRGDWQLLPLLWRSCWQPLRWPLGGINRWKMFDNLRRSLVAPASLALLVVALALPGAGPGVSLLLSPWAALALVLAALCAGPVMGAVAGFSPSRDSVAKRHFYAPAGLDLLRALLGGLWLAAQLLQQALAAADAVGRAVFRMTISHRLLLQWTTAAAAQAAAKTKLADVLRMHRKETALALLLMLLLLALTTLLYGGSRHWGLTVLLCGVWAAAPGWTWWVSRPRPAQQDDPLARLTRAEQAGLHDIARDTWRLFERCVGPADLHLPPDNLQTAPHDMLAHRTSPTNIGLYLLSAACAKQFGWIGSIELLQRLEATLATLGTMQRHRGHFFNWYDTQTGQPLLPSYVSTVDSGNLSGHLLAVAQACREIGHVASSPSHASAALDPAASQRALLLARQRLLPLLSRRTQLTPRERQLLQWQLADHRATRRSAALDTQARHEMGAGGEAQIHTRFHALAHECERIAWQADFNFLYHRKRHLLHLGYRVADQALDAGFYDLLASESRLTSLLAIAKGDVPVRHWAALGRPFYAVGARAGLRSWSGSMFEYLMPTLVLAEPQGSALQQACTAALEEQIAFAHPLRVPWGISESAYAGRDHTLAYQYAPQGVPRLALRRTPPDELVVAPYATLLAAQIAPRLAWRNVMALQALWPRGRYGLVEALDFTASRQTDTSRNTSAFTAVCTFMAHHQGMSIVALANVLLGGVAQRWGMANPSIEAVASLLHERAPREVSVLHAPPGGPAPQAHRLRVPGLLREVIPGANALEPTHLLSNGRYSVSLRANGAGASVWSGRGDAQRTQHSLTRWRDDVLRDALGSFFFLRWTPPVPGTALGDAPPAAALEGAAQMPGLGRNPVPGLTKEVSEPTWHGASITQHPAPDPAAHYSSTFHADRVCFDAAWPQLKVHATVWVSPEDDIEFRQVEVHNLSGQVLDIELVSAFEVTLSEARADEAHPTFTNLFVQAQWQAEQQALRFTRQPRLSSERSLHLAHFLAASDTQVQHLSVQTDRLKWLGRNRLPSQPLGLMQAVEASAVGQAPAPASTLDTGLDPLCAMAAQLRIAPHGKALLTFATAASHNAGTLSAVIDKYRQPSHVERASLMSATLAAIRLRAQRISPAKLEAIQSLTTALVMSVTRPRAHASSQPKAAPGGLFSAAPVWDKTSRVVGGPAGVCDRRLLWRFGLSGDRPLILATVGAPEGLGLLRTLAQALRLWQWGGVACDLVIVNAEPASYQMALQQALASLRENHLAQVRAELGSEAVADRVADTAASTALWVLRAEELSADELSTLKSLARVRFNADGRPLQHHMQEWLALHEAAFDERLEVSNTPLLHGAASLGAPSWTPPQQTPPSRPGPPVQQVVNGQFDTANGEFSFEVSALLRPAKPWINVLSNPGFGAQVSETGAGPTWAVNSRLNQLTAWSNDPVADPASEWFLLQDRRSRQVWSVAPSALGDARLRYRITHGQGSTVISHRRGDAEVTTSWCVDPISAVKQVRLQVVNRGHKTLRWRAVAVAEWLMGAQRADRATVQTAQAAPLNSPAVLLATQRECSAGFGDGTAFFTLVAPIPPSPRSTGLRDAVNELDDEVADDDLPDWTCDRRELFDARGAPVLPDHLGQRSGIGLDPCAALSSSITLAAGESTERVFLLGYGANPEAARRLAMQAATVPAHTRLVTVRSHWDDLLGASTVATPDPLFDVLVNRWLLYQTVSCRLWAKAAFYQAGGATGFRDQLQDTMALAWARPAWLRAQIVLCASRQFEAGDVQHWWHSPGGAGVRTHFSDDLLWLPHACVHYLRCSGDATLWDEQVAFIEGPPIPAGAEDAYYAPTVSATTATVYEHGARAIDHSLRVGVHGLPLMGSGDWNDGMNRVGSEGRGESVWLAWFLCQLVADFAPVAQARGERERAQRWLVAAAGWRAALLGPAWDGQWFKRAFFDNGQALGSQHNSEARIDLIAQAWSVLSGVAPAAEQRMAMQAVDDHLVDAKLGLIRLLDPPLQHAKPSAGYIQAYPPGVRENGGQYSHGAVWSLMARARLAQTDVALGDDANAATRSAARRDGVWRDFLCLSPAHRAQHPTQGPLYGLEPYAVAGDIYSHAPYAGRGGWSWYTGAAAWLHRAALESIFGLSLEPHVLSFRPSLPSHWPRAELTLRREGCEMQFVFVRGAVDQALRTAGLLNAPLLLVGQSLAWRELPAHSRVVVALGD
jgi:cyclic beta-1,2-glucan synthetase